MKVEFDPAKKWLKFQVQIRSRGMQMQGYLTNNKERYAMASYPVW